MPSTHLLFSFALLSLGMALTPGPNMVYLISRTICQGRKAGFISLAGVAAGFLFYLLCAALGITAILFAIPYAYDVLRFTGVIYLLYLAWQALKPGGRSPFQLRELPAHSGRKLFLMGLFTNLLNPKIALLYVALLPQFIDPNGGDILAQSLQLGVIQVAISISINGLVTLAAGSISGFLASRPRWLLIQRWLMGTVLAGLAVRIALQARK